MSFCYYSEKSAWKRAQDALDIQLRELGMPEPDIAQLRAYDWDCFNQERKFYRYLTDAPDLLLETAEAEHTNFNEINVESFLSQIKNVHLQIFLAQVDKQTIQALLLRYAGYSGREIERIIGIPEHAINNRITRLLKQLKKYFSNAI